MSDRERQLLRSIELRHLRYFVAVAEELHFGRAAKRLNMAQPPLSHQIRQLEAALHTVLFTRTSRRVNLTLAGAAFLVSARRALAEMESSFEVARRAGRGEVASLRVGFTDSAALTILAAVVRRFRERVTGIHLILSEDSSAAQIEAVEQDVLDVAFVRGPVSNPGRVQVTPVFREPFVVALPADHALVRRPSVGLAALSNESIITFPRVLAREFHDVIAGMCSRAEIVEAEVHRGKEFLSMLSLVAAGLGVSLVPSSVQQLALAGVVFRPLTNVAERAEIVAVRRADRESDALRTLISIAESCSTPERVKTATQGHRHR